MKQLVKYCGLVTLVVGLLVSGSVASGKGVNESKLPASVSELYLQAERTIIRNCATCMGATKEGMLVGVQKLEELIQDGYASAEASIILANAYNQMMIVYASNKKESEVWKGKKTALLTKAVVDFPLDRNLLTQYADTVESYPEKVKIYRKAFNMDPSNTRAGYSLCIYLLELNLKNEAFEVAKKAIPLSEPGPLRAYFSRGILYKFRDAGMKEEAVEVSRLVDKRFAELMKPN